MAELDLWKAAGVDLDKSKGPWYRDTGQGMGPALNTASSMNAYMLADRGTWLAFKNRGDLAILVEGRQAPVQPVRRDAGQSREASEREEGSRPEVRRLARVARRAEGDRRATRSAASSCSSRTQAMPTHERSADSFWPWRWSLAPPRPRQESVRALRRGQPARGDDRARAGLHGVGRTRGHHHLRRVGPAPGAHRERRRRRRLRVRGHRQRSRAGARRPRRRAGRLRAQSAVRAARARRRRHARDAARPHARSAHQAGHVDAESRSLRRLCVAAVRESREAAAGRLRRAGQEGAETRRRRRIRRSHRPVARSTAFLSRKARPIFS